MKFIFLAAHIDAGFLGKAFSIGAISVFLEGLALSH